MSNHHIVLPSAPLYAQPSVDAELETECLYGERFDVSRFDGDFALGQLVVDGYQGWVPAAALGQIPEPTHRVLVPSSWVRDSSNIKSRSIMPLSIGCRVQVSDVDDANNCCSLLLAGSVSGFIPVSHIVSVNTTQPDWVAIAESLLGTPYLWGGRTAAGLDCSALVQLAAQSAHIALPRNTSQQQHQGKPIDSVERLQRGDLVFWKGHVGLMQSDTQLLHANAHHMQVVSEPLQAAITRIQQKEGPVTAMKRLVAG